MYVYVCSVVANYDKATAEFLLPYLVWSVMTLGTDENKKKVMELLTATLKESQDKTKYSEGPQCVQFVYNIIDSLNKLVSENAKVKDKRAPSSTYRSGRGGGGSSTSTSSSGTGSGSGDQLFLGFDTSPQFLSEFNKMLDDVAFDVFKAAIASKSYPRALLYFEKYAKITQVTSTTLRGYYEQLQEAYLNLNDVDSLAYISSIAKDASSKDYIRYLEYSGKWHEALICYDTAFSLSSSSSAMPFSSTTSSSSSSSSFQPRPPLDPSLILGRLECLKKSATLTPCFHSSRATSPHITTYPNSNFSSSSSNSSNNSYCSNRDKSLRYPSLHCASNSSNSNNNNSPLPSLCPHPLLLGLPLYCLHSHKSL